MKKNWVITLRTGAFWNWPLHILHTFSSTLWGTICPIRAGRLLKLGKGEASTGGADKESTLADAFESVIAAVYFDAGFEIAKKVVLENLSDTINDAMEGRLFLDYKSRLLEIAQKKNNQHKITFEIVGESGPAHMREFETEIRADRVFLARAKGHSKKDSEQKCAKEAIEKYKEIFGA